jgi:hypothetical protein
MLIPPCGPATAGSPCCFSAEKSRARFFAQFILSGQSEILRFAQNDSEELRMTAWETSDGDIDGFLF